MHCIRAELQGEHDGRVRGAQGHALLMSGGLSWWVVRASGMRPTFGGYGKFEGRQQLRSDPAHVAVFADHPPPPKLEGIVEEVDVDEYTESD